MPVAVIQPLVSYKQAGTQLLLITASASLNVSRQSACDRASWFKQWNLYLGDALFKFRQYNDLPEWFL